ncbi:ead/Ea22-like family protein [Enterobacter hormaechei]|uniref:ead/Ea22-like family protein n=1 Tax=Enterobacter hormaechei TaxID=158836 RepID=UPI002093C104|nr:ead/Ea22-like family protein [Enterobacter hormaechei]MCO6014903.1 ead/Ea22-like family protein [Enterobacter hormaechei]
MNSRPMSNIDKHALREAAEKASTDNHTQDEGSTICAAQLQKPCWRCWMSWKPQMR